MTEFKDLHRINSTLCVWSCLDLLQNFLIALSRERCCCSSDDMQQNSKSQISYWYYNKPSITKVVPDRGPDDGGNDVLLLGNNFDPFKNYPVDNYNDTFCNFEGLTLTPAKVINSNKVLCKAPPSHVYREAEVELTLNNQ